MAENLNHDRLRSVRIWLWITAALVVLMIMVGGATRLTGSGLSITEWNLVTGAIPPLSEAAWMVEFEKYQQISQYQLVNRGMSLGEFKFIYWWEWGHRQLGRFIGLFYLAGFLLTVAARRVDLKTGLILFGMGLLLGLQGAVGWIMVASGLEPGMTAVAPVKLTLHLGLACLFFASLIAMIGKLGGYARETVPCAVRAGAWSVLGLLFVQILLGGLVAGSKAGLIFNTWPLMDGRLVPPAASLFAVSPWWENFVDNVALVQFNHRLVAYMLLAAVIWHMVAVRRSLGKSPASKRAMGLMHALIVQAVIGILTLIYAGAGEIRLDLGLTHQFVAVIALGLAVRHVVASRAP